MVVKFFSNKKGGSSKAVNYLLNHREQEGTARVLQGDPYLTKQIINNIKFKQKTTVGCLSFEEQNISEEMKHQLIEDFERMLIPGLDKSRYNILWVEHRDKGRLELNFVIPKIELETQKSLNPYYHKADLPRVEKWQDLQNLTHNFTNPKDPSKARNVEINSHIKKFNKSYEELNENIQELATQGHIQNREQLIELLKNSGIEVTRSGKDYISVKLPDSKKARKFKGGIYHEQFISIREIENISKTAEQRVEQYNNRDTQREYERLSKQLKDYTQTKERELRQKYINTPRAINKEDNQELTRDRELARERIKSDRGNDKRETRAREQSQSNINGDSNIHNNSNIDNRGSNVNSEQAVQQGRLNNLSYNKSYNKEVENDSTRTSINARSGTRERAEFKAYINFTKAGTRLSGELTATAKIIREQHLENSRQLRNKPLEDNEYLRIQYNTEYERNEKRTAKAREYCVRYFEANKSDFRHKYNFWRNWRELSRAVTELEKTSLGLTAGAKRIENELRKYYHENVSISSLNTQQKIFLKNYHTLPSNSNLKSFFISKQADHVKLISYKQKVHIKDYGDKITASNTSNQDLLIKMMIDIAEAKGWDLNRLNIKGSEEFIIKAKAEVSNRLEKKRELERANQYSRGYYR